MEWKRNCREFMGSYACEILKENKYRDCTECKFYEPIEKKILIIKLGALGDILRATTILPALKMKYKNCHITWLVKDNGKELLEGNPYINRIIIFKYENILPMQQEQFDILINLDADNPSIAVASLTDAKEKFGFYLNKDGHPSAFNQSAEYYLETQFSDIINKSNRKTVQQMFFEIAELPYSKQDYILNLDGEQKRFMEQFKEKNKIEDAKIIGVHIGAGGERWPSKAWGREQLERFIGLAARENLAKVIVFAGPQDAELQEDIINSLMQKGIKLGKNNPGNTLKEFIAAANACDIMVCGDSLALHVAAALKKKVVALFFCTPPWEIEDYGRITRIVSPLFEENFFIDWLDEGLVNSISAEQVFEAVQKIIYEDKK